MKQEKKNELNPYYTQWVHKGKLYSETIYAKSKKQAEKMLESKKLTEHIVGYDPNTVLLDD